MAEDKSKGTGKDPNEGTENPAEALVESGADVIPDGTGDPNKTDHRVEVHASISEGSNSNSKTSGRTGSGPEGRKA
ncbi:hypothetical protein QNO00_09820 [Arthrobacter sp. zg-Y1219]|uniref:hypothetical protein n=1 Tax=Arthrobacter sp. zg-Y1219 TaxID=3049067 RepID=UPI0024C36CE5|nr:hypothetical protein [Arthrobacter sp. zg-Y1219]MDK1360563.1 hypothetical protein [Arthrobacter sp. zg-Y1219]